MVNIEGGYDTTENDKTPLKNMWTFCSKNAIKALSATLNKKMVLGSVSVKSMMLDKVPSMLNPKDTKTTVFWTPLEDGISGVMLINSSYNDILKMADMLLKKEIGYYKTINEESEPIINELIKVIAGYYMDTFVKLFNIKLKESSWSTNPYSVIEFLGMGNVYREKIEVLVLNTKFIIPEEGIKVNTIALFKNEFTDKIINTINTRMAASFNF